MSLRHTWLSSCLAAGVLAVASQAQARLRTWSLDPVHTRIAFAVEHAGFSNALGTFSGATGTLAFDPDAGDWAGARLEVQVPVARLDLGDAEWNEATLARKLLDAEAHPFAGFVSTRVDPVDPTHATVHGLLTLRGETREVALDVVLNAVQRHPMPPFRRTAGFSATATIRRGDFGIDAWKSIIGDTVELRIEAEATLARTRDDAHGPGIDEQETGPAPAADEPPAQELPATEPDATP